MINDTIQVGWETLNTASTDQDALDEYQLAYSGTWVTGAQNPAVKPSSARQLPLDANSVKVRFLIANADNEDTGAMIWLWDANGAPMDAITLLPVTAGTTLVTTHPVTGATLTLHYYADTITVTQDNCNAEVIGTTNGIAELRFDLMGASWIYCNYDSDAGDSTMTDCVSIFKYL